MTDKEKLQTLVELLSPIFKAVFVNSRDTLARCYPDSHVIWTATGSWSQPAPITLGNLRDIAKFADANLQSELNKNGT